MPSKVLVKLDSKGEKLPSGYYNATVKDIHLNKMGEVIVNIKTQGDKEMNAFEMVEAMRKANKFPVEEVHSLVWNTNNGRVLPIHMMDTQHILNILSYINKRVEEFQKVQEQAKERGYVLPAMKVNGELPDYWIELFLKELNNQVLAEIEEAKTALKEAKAKLKILKKEYE